MKLIIEDDEGRKTVVPLVREEITIGRQDGNTIRLTERNVSRRHARLVKDNGSLVIEDLGSYNGVRVNGDRIQGPTKIKEGDLIEIGDYDLGIQGKLETPTQSAPAPVTSTRPGMKAVAPAARPAPTPAANAPVASATTAEAAPLEPTRPAQPTPSGGVTPSASAGGATAIIRVSDIMKSAPAAEVRDLAKSEMPRLVGLAGSVRGKEFYLMKSEVKFGRTEDNDIGIDHQSVSRQHARFVLEDGGWKVYDNKSANGVHINGEMYAISAVKPGDTLELGHLKFRFCAPGEKFTPPTEKSEKAEQAAANAPRPTTAELIAGASQPGRMQSQAPAAKKGKGITVAIIAGVVVLALAAVVALKVVGGHKDGEGEEGGESAGALLKEGDKASASHDYAKASEKYEEAAAAGATVPAGKKKKADGEAEGQKVFNALETAIGAADFDKAKLMLDKCSTETTFFCQKAQEKAEPVKAGYAKLHLGRANAAKAAGKSDVCQSEVGLVLAFDPGNAEAQTVQCAPQAPAVKEAPKPAGDSQASRDKKAGALIQDGNAKVQGKDYDGAIARFTDATNLKPSKQLLGFAYRGLGTAYVWKGDTKNAVKWFKLYLPLCPDSDKPQVQAIIQRYGG